MSATTILAIDPGPKLSAYVEIAGARILAHDKIGNVELLGMLRGRDPQGPLVVEMMAPYGRIVGREVFNTCVWTGRFLEAWRGVGRLLTRQEVKGALGLTMRSTDADVRAALIARWSRKAAVSKGADPAAWVVGTKRDPGPLFGITRDQWAALAVAVAWKEQHGDAFAAVEAAPLSGLEGLNRVLGLDTAHGGMP